MPTTGFVDRVAFTVRRFLAYACEHSLPLPAGAVIALTWVNVHAASYHSMAHALEFPVNDIGMVFFFALAAKEVVEATGPGGALHTWRRAALPCIAAIGGMAAPALLYLLHVTLAGNLALARGWAIPCATDIAFSYLVAKAIFRRHPAIPFLLLLAIADDAFALVVLAVFYPAGDVKLTLGGAFIVAGLAVAYALRRGRVDTFWPYVLGGGMLTWFGLFQGGLHPALALVPVMPFLPHASRDAGLFAEPRPMAHDPLTEFARWWKYPVQLILFLFGLGNAGVPFGSAGQGTWAVLSAILIGKPLGISIAVGAAVMIGFKLPSRLDRRDIVVTGCAAGIGFTVALFFATAAFPPGPLRDEAKIGALLSVASAAIALAAAAVLGVGRFRVSRAERP
jgi:NhaA family Na+:H+ antiporter